MQCDMQGGVCLVREGQVVMELWGAVGLQVSAVAVDMVVEGGNNDMR